MTRSSLQHRLEKAESLLAIAQAYGWDTARQEAHCQCLRDELAAIPEDDSMAGLVESIGELVGEAV